MASSFTKRFAGREPEVVAEIKCFGCARFCEHEGIAGFSPSLQQWFSNQPGCKDDSVLHYISSESPVQDLPIAKQILLAVQNMRTTHDVDMAKIKAHYENLLIEKDRLIERYRENERFNHLSEYKRLAPVFEICREYIRGDAVRI